MKIYNVEILETYRKVVEVRASNASAARDMAIRAHGAGEIVLTADNYIGADYSAEMAGED